MSCVKLSRGNGFVHELPNATFEEWSRRACFVWVGGALLQLHPYDPDRKSCRTLLHGQEFPASLSLSLERFSGEVLAGARREVLVQDGALGIRRKVTFEVYQASDVRMVFA